MTIENRFAHKCIMASKCSEMKSMIIIKAAIIIAAVIAGCLSPVHAGETAQTVNDSIVAPNVFTPNNDSKNDVFEVRSREDNVVSLKVFTRTGGLIFSIEAKCCRWDGRSLTGQEMANGMYYYTAEVKGVSPKVNKCGFVHLFR